MRLSSMQRSTIDLLFPEPVRLKIARIEFRHEEADETFIRNSSLIMKLRADNERTRRHYEHRLTTGMRDASTEASQLRQEMKLREVRIADAENFRSAIGEERRTFSSILDAIIAHLPKIGHGRIAKVSDHKRPTLRKGETIIDAINRCRARVAELKSGGARIASAAIPTALAKERARREIEAIAEIGRPNVLGLLAGDDGIGFAKSMTRITDIVAQEGSTGHVVEQVDSLALLAFLFRDKLIAAVEHEIDASTDAEAEAEAMTPADRKMAGRKIEQEIEEIERDECALIEDAENAGMKILPRADIGIRAFLGISSETEDATKAAMPAQGGGIFLPVNS